jgi:hypothetical protein
VRPTIAMLHSSLSQHSFLTYTYIHTRTKSIPRYRYIPTEWHYNASKCYIYKHTTAKRRTLRDIPNLLRLGVEADCFRGWMRNVVQTSPCTRGIKRDGRNKQRSGGNDVRREVRRIGERGGQEISVTWMGKVATLNSGQFCPKIELIFRAQSVLLEPYLES